MAFAAGLGVALGGLVRIESLSPLRLVSALRLDAVRDAGWDLTLRSAASIQSAGMNRAVWLLVGLAAVALAAVCLNLTVLSLMRAAGRRRDLIIQRALGAPPWLLRRRTALEGLAIAVAGGLAGLLVGFAAAGALALSWPHGSESLSRMALQTWALIVGLLAPAVALIGPPLAATLGSLEREAATRLLAVGERATPNGAQRLGRQALVVLQVAGSLVCLATAGLLAASSAPGHEDVALGFDPGDSVIVELDLADGNSESDARRADGYAALVRRVGSLDGVEGVALSTPGALAAIGAEGVATAECGVCSIGGLRTSLSPAVARHHAVSPGFFAAAHATLLAGREFGAEDRAGAALVAIVNQSFAQHHFQAGDPIGKRVQVGGPWGRWYTVVGVVGDLRGTAIGSAPDETPALYLPLAQQPARSVDLIVRGAEVEPDALEAAVMAALGESNLAAGPSEPAALQARLVYQALPVGWLARVLALLGLLTLAIAIHGTAAVMRYEVRQRRAEIAVRSALGARPWMIVGMVVKQTLRLTVAGLGLGLLATFPIGDWLGRILPRLQVDLPLLLGGTLVALAITAVVAAAWPANRAARLDPARALQTN